MRSSLWHTADTSPDTLNTKDNTKQVMNIELAHILGWHQSRGSGKKKHFIYFFNVINTRAPAAAIYKKKSLSSHPLKISHSYRQAWATVNSFTLIKSNSLKKKCTSSSSSNRTICTTVSRENDHILRTLER